jgi:hypothetical protein
VYTPASRKQMIERACNYLTTIAHIPCCTNVIINRASDITVMGANKTTHYTFERITIN